MELVRLAEKANLKPLEFLRSAVVLEKEGQLPQVSHWFCPCPIGQRKQRDREDRARIRRESSDDLH
jgi:hypothetical protein